MKEDEKHQIDVIGIGDPIVDIFAHVTEDFLKKNRIKKNSMKQISKKQINKLIFQLDSSVKIICGGSAASTISTLSFLGNRCAFYGSIGNDDFGKKIKKDFKRYDTINLCKVKKSNFFTSRCLLMITPDKERTMRTYIGASSLFSQDDIDLDVIKKSKVIFIELYVLLNKNGGNILRYIIENIEKDQKIAISLGDVSIVKTFKKEIFSILPKCKIITGNNYEFSELYGIRNPQNTKLLAQKISLVKMEETTRIITCGAQGASIIDTNNKIHKIPAIHVEKLSDTTGAGDSFFGGFLWAYLKKCPPVICGLVGSIIASKVVNKEGARLTKRDESIIETISGLYIEGTF